MQFETNRDPNYFNEECMHANCGSFAFNIREWYCPDECFDQDDLELAAQLIDDEGLDETDVIRLLFDRNVEQIHQDFELKDVDNKDYPLKDNEELIAFRMCINRTFYDDELVVDYHFRVKREGKWMEKCGIGRVRTIEDYNEDPWVEGEDLIYWGPIAYFVKKCS